MMPEYNQSGGKMPSEDLMNKQGMPEKSEDLDSPVADIMSCDPGDESDKPPQGGDGYVSPVK